MLRIGRICIFGIGLSKPADTAHIRFYGLLLLQRGPYFLCKPPIVRHSLTFVGMELVANGVEVPMSIG